MRSAFALLALAQLAIGAAAIFARFALTGGGPIAVSAFRLLVAAVPIVLFAALRGAYRRHDRATEGRLVWAGIALAAHFACWFASLRYASVAVSTLLVCTTPLWTEAYAVFRLRRIRLDVALSIAFALGGVAIVVGAPARGETPLGIGLALAGAVAIAVYLMLVRASDAHYGTLAVVARTYPVAALALLAATLVSRDPVPSATNAGAWAGILAMAFISQLFGHTALNAAVRRLSATLVATVTLVEPAVAGILAALIFGERLAPGTFVGGLLVLAGIALALRSEPRLTAAPAGTPTD
jgi:drug/metabolite transporter (DMT)-like permease